VRGRGRGRGRAVVAAAAAARWVAEPHLPDELGTPTTP
jgi:hypothetical protein